MKQVHYLIDRHQHYKVATTLQEELEKLDSITIYQRSQVGRSRAGRPSEHHHLLCGSVQMCNERFSLLPRSQTCHHQDNLWLDHHWPTQERFINFNNSTPHCTAQGRPTAKVTGTSLGAGSSAGGLLFHTRRDNSHAALPRHSP